MVTVAFRVWLGYSLCCHRIIFGIWIQFPVWSMALKATFSVKGNVDVAPVVDFF